MMTSYTVILFLSLLLLFILKLRKNVEKKKAKLPPGPPKLPIIGNLHQLTTMPHRSLYELAKQHGPLMHLQLGPVPALVISSAKMAREFLKTHDADFCSRPPLVGPKRLSYNYKDVAFAPYGGYWREIKKICIQELFSAKRVQSFAFIREEEVELMINSISQSSSSFGSKSVNLSELVLSLVNNIVCRIAIGKRYQEVCVRSRFQDILLESQIMLGCFRAEDYFSSVGWIIDILTRKQSRLEKNFWDLDAVYEGVIEEHLDPMRKVTNHEDIVDVLLRLEKDQVGAIHLTKDHIKAVLMDIFVAGTDPSAAALVWGMTELIKNPRVMKKVQDEVRSSILKKEKVEERNLHQLPYLKSVVKEILRLHPPGPLLATRETISNCRINEYDIYPKTRVIVSPFAIGRDPEAWKDPDEFYPERFMGTEIDFKGSHFQLVPFGGGRRGCPGMHLGSAIVELALANLLYCFNWELPEGVKKEDLDMEEAPGLSTHKKIELNLVPRPTNLEIN